MLIDRGTIVYNKVREKYYLSLGVSVFETDAFELSNLYSCTAMHMTSKSFETAYALLGADCKKQYWKRSAEIFGQVYYALGETYDSSVFNQSLDTTKIYKFGSTSLFYFELDKNFSDKIDDKVIDAWLLKNKIMGVEIPECENLENSLKRHKDIIDGYKWCFNQTKRIMVDIILHYLKETSVLAIGIFEKDERLYFVSYKSMVILDVVETNMTPTKKMLHYVYAILLHLFESKLNLQDIFNVDEGTKIISLEDFSKQYQRL